MRDLGRALDRSAPFGGARGKFRSRSLSALPPKGWLVLSFSF